MTELPPFDFAALLLGEELISATRTEFAILLNGRSESALVRLVPAGVTAAVVWDHTGGSQMLLYGQADYVKAEFSRLASSLSGSRRLAYGVRRWVVRGREMRGQLAAVREFACWLRRLVARNAVRGRVQAAQ